MDRQTDICCQLSFRCIFRCVERQLSMFRCLIKHKLDMMLWLRVYLRTNALFGVLPRGGVVSMLIPLFSMASNSLGNTVTSTRWLTSVCDFDGPPKLSCRSSDQCRCCLRRRTCLQDFCLLAWQHRLLYNSSAFLESNGPVVHCLWAVSVCLKEATSTTNGEGVSFCALIDAHDCGALILSLCANQAVSIWQLK